MTAREDFRAAVREGITYRSSDALAAMIYAAGDAYVTAALLSLAADLERFALTADTDSVIRTAGSAYRHAAQMARERASASPGATNPAQSVSGDAGTGSVDLGDADDCMEAGP